MPVAHELAPVSSPDSVGASCLPLANRTRAGRRDCGGGAPFGPGSHGPSGQAKERTRILPVRRGFLRPARRAMCRAGRSCAACRCYVGFCARCPGVFSASAAYARGFFGTVCPVCLPCALCAQFCFVLAVCLPVPCWLHARFSLIFYLLPFPA